MNLFNRYDVCAVFNFKRSIHPTARWFYDIERASSQYLSCLEGHHRRCEAIIILCSRITDRIASSASAQIQEKFLQSVSPFSCTVTLHQYTTQYRVYKTHFTLTKENEFASIPIYMWMATDTEQEYTTLIGVHLVSISWNKGILW